MDAKSSLIQPTFFFDDRKRFDAQNEHDQVRSSIQSHTEIPTIADPWKQRPVDFTMKNFHPNRKKDRNRSSSEEPSPREKLTGNSRKSDSSVMRPFAVGYQHPTNTSLADNQPDDDKPFRVDPRINYNKIHRMLNTEQYQNPQLHDYRQVISNIFIVNHPLLLGNSIQISNNWVWRNFERNMIEIRIIFDFFPII